MKKIILSTTLIYISSCSQAFGAETFKTRYFYENNPKVTEARVKECKTLNEMTFGIEKDCQNAFKAYRYNRMSGKSAINKNVFDDFKNAPRPN